MINLCRKRERFDWSVFTFDSYITNDTVKYSHKGEKGNTIVEIDLVRETTTVSGCVGFFEFAKLFRPSFQHEIRTSWYNHLIKYVNTGESIYDDSAFTMALDSVMDLFETISTQVIFKGTERNITVNDMVQNYKTEKIYRVNNIKFSDYKVDDAIYVLYNKDEHSETEVTEDEFYGSSFCPKMQESIQNFHRYDPHDVFYGETLIRQRDGARLKIRGIERDNNSYLKFSYKLEVENTDVVVNIDASDLFCKIYKNGDKFRAYYKEEDGDERIFVRKHCEDDEDDLLFGNDDNPQERETCFRPEEFDEIDTEENEKEEENMIRDDYQDIYRAPKGAWHEDAPDFEPGDIVKCSDGGDIYLLTGYPITPSKSWSSFNITTGMQEYISDGYLMSCSMDSLNYTLLHKKGVAKNILCQELKFLGSIPTSADLAKVKYVKVEHVFFKNMDCLQMLLDLEAGKFHFMNKELAVDRFYEYFENVSLPDKVIYMEVRDIMDKLRTGTTMKDVVSELEAYFLEVGVFEDRIKVHDELLDEIPEEKEDGIEYRRLV
jgi:hypothetical protein